MIDMLNHERMAEGESGVNIGIGIATGDVVAGYAGTNDRATYTCIGSTVNLAARLEAHTKQTGGGILVDKTTLEQLDGITQREVHKGVEIKGFSDPVDVFAI